MATMGSDSDNRRNITTTTTTITTATTKMPHHATPRCARTTATTHVGQKKKKCSDAKLNVEFEFEYGPPGLVKRRTAEEERRAGLKTGGWM